MQQEVALGSSREASCNKRVWARGRPRRQNPGRMQLHACDAPTWNTSPFTSSTRPPGPVLGRMDFCIQAQVRAEVFVMDGDGTQGLQALCGAEWASAAKVAQACDCANQCLHNMAGRSRCAQNVAKLL